MRRRLTRRRLALRLLSGFVCLLAAVILLMPMAYTLFNSLMSPDEVGLYYRRVFVKDGPPAMLHLIPDHLSFEAYYRVLLGRPDYLEKFWNSLGLGAAVVAIQALVSCMGGFALAKYRFRGRQALFFLMVVLMMLPIQVTLMPNYIVLDRLGLMDSWWALILPAGFLPLWDLQKVLPQF